METNIFKMITIADIASLCNALSGLLAVFAVLMGYNIVSAQLLLLAVIFDSVDGTLARKFNHNVINSIFGENMDSLSDIVSFGVAPALILYTLSDTYYVIVPCLLLVACGILRLTRYNTLLVNQEGPTRTFIGLPIPVSSFMLAALILSSISNFYLMCGLMIIIALLMISDIKYPKIRDKRIIGIAGLIVILCIIPSVNTLLFLIPSYLLVIMTLVYIFGTLVYNYMSLDSLRRINLDGIRNNFSNSDNDYSESSKKLYKR